MEITQVYAIAMAGFFLAFVVKSFLHVLVACSTKIRVFLLRHFFYSSLIHRHSLLGPLGRVHALAQLINVAINVFFLSFQASSISKAGTRAGTLSLINMVPVFAGPHLSFLSNLTGMTLKTHRRLHRSAGIMSFALMLFHVLVLISDRISFSSGDSANLYPIMGISAVSILVVLSYPWCRKFSYEVFLRVHQALAALFFFCVWKHVSSTSSCSRLYLYIMLGAFSLSFVLHVMVFLYHNGILRNDLPRATLIQDKETVKLNMSLSRPLKVRAGQYINLWIPSVSFWSFLQSHPFMVTSWSENKQRTLELLIEPRKGLTRELFHHSKLDGAKITSRLALFSGPHGVPAPVERYESVLMIAAGHGIAAQLPYVRRLINGYNTGEVRTCRMHLVWQLESLNTGLAVESLLQEILEEDARSLILNISVYLEAGNVKEINFGKHAKGYAGVVDVQNILLDEVNKKDIEMNQYAKMLVIVSGTNKLRDDLREAVKNHLTKNVIVEELEYQPQG